MESKGSTLVAVHAIFMFLHRTDLPHMLVCVAPDSCKICLSCLQVHEPRIRAQLKSYYIGDLQQLAETATEGTQ